MVLGEKNKEHGIIFRASRAMSPESKYILAGSYRYQGRRHHEKCVLFCISRTIHFTTKGVATFFIPYQISLFFCIQLFFVTLIF